MIAYKKELWKITDFLSLKQKAIAIEEPFRFVTFEKSFNLRKENEETI